MSNIQLVTFLDVNSPSASCVRIIIEEEPSHLFKSAAYHINGDVLSPISGCSFNSQINAEAAFEVAFSQVLQSSIGPKMPKDFVLMVNQAMIKPQQLLSIFNKLGFSYGRTMAI